MAKRSEGALERLWRAEQLMNEGKVDEARPLVESLEKEAKFPPDALLSYNLLRSQFLFFSGDSQSSRNLAEQVMKESLERGMHLQAVSACLVLADVLMVLDNYDKSSEVITQGEQILKRSHSSSSVAFTKHQATLIHLRGRIYLLKGNLDQAFEYFQKSWTIRQKLGNKHDIAISLRNIGVVHAERGDIDQGLDCHFKALNLFREVGNKFYIAWCLTNIGMFLTQKGEFDQALKNSQKGLSLFQELGNKNEISYALGIISAICEQKGELDRALEYCQKKMLIDKELDNRWNTLNTLGELAIIHVRRGELDQALEYQHQRLKLAQEIGHKLIIANSIGSIGYIYWQKGELDRAMNQMEESLVILNEEGSNMDSTGILFRLVSVALDKGSREQAQDYLQQMQPISKRLDNKLSDQLCRLAEAILLKTSPRIKDKVKAQEIFQQITDEKTIYFHITETAMVNLCELLLDELKAYGESSVLQEVKTLVQKLYTSAQNQHSFSSAITALILQAKFAMIEGNLTAAIQFLDQALLTAEENNLGLLGKKVAIEKQQLEDQFDTWRKFLRDNASFEERLEHAQVTEYLKDVKKLVSMQSLKTSS